MNEAMAEYVKEEVTILARALGVNATPGTVLSPKKSILLDIDPWALNHGPEMLSKAYLEPLAKVLEEMGEGAITLDASFSKEKNEITYRLTIFLTW